MRNNGWLFIGLVSVALLLVVCALTFFPVLVSVSTEVHPVVALETPVPTAVPELPTTVPDGGSSGKVDLDKIFPPGKVVERELVIFSCSDCHTWVCTIRGRQSARHWRSIQFVHDRSLFPALSDEDYQLIFDFLSENFNDASPVLDLPEALEGLGCTYPW